MPSVILGVEAHSLMFSSVEKAGSKMGEIVDRIEFE